MGRPTSYQPEKHIAAVHSLAEITDAEIAATWEQIATVCEVAESTVKLWAEKHIEFSAAIKRVKGIADDRMENAMYSNGVGGQLIERKVITKKNGETIETERYAKGDTAAQVFWLCNRRPERWQHVQKIEYSGSVDHSGKLEVDVKDSLSEYTEAAGEVIEEAEAHCEAAATT